MRRYASDPDAYANPPAKKRPLGPKGGRTTMTRDGLMQRKTFFLDVDVAERLRDVAHQRRLEESVLIREAVRKYLDVED
jgi:hypothetical protein